MWQSKLKYASNCKLNKRFRGRHKLRSIKSALLMHPQPAMSLFEKRLKSLHLIDYTAFSALGSSPLLCENVSQYCYLTSHLNWKD